MGKDNELLHYGILGMKWGVRRYQNEDGTLTAAGRERYGKLIEKINKQNEKLTRKGHKLNLKSAKYNLKSAKIEKKIYKRINNAKNVPSDMAKKKIKYSTKAAKLSIKAEKAYKK